ncbi:hypothetical protein ACE193_25370 (plasmid) [Bernardetia sp. OM2101]|uniref:hypothetical protein n=1 Tax=Bernardetia sp. OM2101 TaxID=3344876 RepID=UPI0035CEEB48
MNNYKNFCICKDAKNQDKTVTFVLSNSKKVEQLELFPMNDYKEIEPREKGERCSYRCPNCGRFVSKEIWKMFPKIYKEETYHHTVKRVRIGGFELPNAA